MKRLIYEPEAGRVLVEDEAGVREHPLETREAFNAVSEAWLRVEQRTEHELEQKSQNRRQSEDQEEHTRPWAHCQVFAEDRENA